MDSKKDSSKKSSSSKKEHKEKDRERDKDDKTSKEHIRDRDRERERDRDRERDREHRSSKSVKKTKRSHSSSGSENERPVLKDDKSGRKKRHIDEVTKNDEPIFSGGGDKTDLSIEETNALRAKLGLKPLQVDSGQKTVSATGNKIYRDEDTAQMFEHVPAKDLVALKEETKLREKLHEQREKRQLQTKYRTKIHGESDEEESASDWVLKLKQKQLEKEQAAKKAKSLEEMDDLISESTKPAKKAKGYSSKELTGLTVEHAQEMFNEGQEMILTLKDKKILDEDGDEDVLVNVNLVDTENAKKNVDNKATKPVYKPYADFDEFGIFQEKKILDKYDSEIDGEKKRSFKLGSMGEYDTSMDRFIESQNEEFKKRAIRLTLDELKPSSDYLSKEEQDEMKFKKPKKLKKKLRSKMVKADDLVPLEDEKVSAAAATAARPMPKSEIDKRKVEKSSPEKKISLKGIDFELEAKSESDEEDGDYGAMPREEHLNLPVRDEALDELHETLTKIRKRAIRSKIDEIAEKILSNADEERAPGGEIKMVDLSALDLVEGEPEADLFRPIMLDSTSEFCRNLGDMPSYGLAGNRAEDEEQMMEAFEADKMMESGAVEPVEEDDEMLEDREDDAKSEDEDGVESKPILDDEPMVDRGLGSALKLAVNKGYLVQEKSKQNARLRENISAKVITVEEKNYDIDDKYSRTRDRYFGGPVSEFREKEAYKPEIKLEYMDETGHMMNEKEAFRYLSHRFHGKGSGKKKTEKRTNKIKELETMNKMSSIDTPLNTVALQQEKQKRLQQPYIVLSAPKGKNDNIPLKKP